jgi:hypothetical protein
MSNLVCDELPAVHRSKRREEFEQKAAKMGGLSSGELFSRMRSRVRSIRFPTLLQILAYIQFPGYWPA